MAYRLVPSRPIVRGVSVALAGGKDYRFLSHDRWFLHARLVSPFVRPTRDVQLMVEQGGKNLYCVDCCPGHPLAATEEAPVVFDLSTPNIVSGIYQSFFFRGRRVLCRTVPRTATASVLGLRDHLPRMERYTQLHLYPPKGRPYHPDDQ